MAEDEKLPKLTDKQLRFVLGVQSGLTQSDAYRQAYNCKNTPPNQIWVRASEVASTSNVSVWLARIKEQAFQQASSVAAYTKDKHLEELSQTIEQAKASGNWGAAINAIISKGKACNHYQTQVEINHTSSKDKDLLQQLETMLGKEAAQAAAARLGYTTATKH